MKQLFITFLMTIFQLSLFSQTTQIDLKGKDIKSTIDKINSKFDQGSVDFIITKGHILYWGSFFIKSDSGIIINKFTDNGDDGYSKQKFQYSEILNVYTKQKKTNIDFYKNKFLLLGQSSQTLVVDSNLIKNQTEQYCMVIAKSFSWIGENEKYTISIDFGQSFKGFSFGEGNVLKDKDGNLIQFNSEIDALNYMNSQGWIFVSRSEMTDAGGKSMRSHDLMKKILK